jgi:ABC-type polysaccharide/polyol phosphate export permease
MIETIRTIVHEHVTYKDQIFTLAKSDLIKTYRGAALGWAWAVIKPMVTLFVFWFAFTVGLRHGKPIAGYPFFLWLVAGFLPWFFMQEMITGGAACIRKYKMLVTKMKFPISIIPTYYNLSHLFTHFVLLAITIVLFMCFGHMPDVYLLQIPFYMLEMLAFFYAGEDFLVAAHKNGKTLYCPELLGNAAAAPGILAALGCTEGHFRTPGDGHPGAMLHPLVDKVNPPRYLGLMFE